MPKREDIDRLERLLSPMMQRCSDLDQHLSRLMAEGLLGDCQLLTRIEQANQACVEALENYLGTSALSWWMYDNNFGKNKLEVMEPGWKKPRRLRNIRDLARHILVEGQFAIQPVSEGPTLTANGGRVEIDPTKGFHIKARTT